MTFWSEMKRCGRAGCARCPHGPYWYGLMLGRRWYFGRTEPYHSVIREVMMSSDSVLKERIAHALDVVGTIDCPCGVAGERWVVLRWLAATREVSVEIECRSCHRTAIAPLQLHRVPGVKEAIA